MTTTTKHRKRKKPSDTSRTTPDELEDSQGANTIEGDVENDTESTGGINKNSRNA
jgi:hypothetical protein